MAVETTYSSLRENLASVLDRVTDDNEVVIVRRKGAKRDVALIPADELSSLLETAHLLQSPANAHRLLSALNRVRRGEGKKLTLAQLRREVGLEPEP